jgi:hypothetical protein
VGDRGPGGPPPTSDSEDALAQPEDSSPPARRGPTGQGGPAGRRGRSRRRSRVALGLCFGLLLTVGSGLAGAMSGHDTQLALDSQILQTGVLPVPEATASQAASYW